MARPPCIDIRTASARILCMPAAPLRPFVESLWWASSPAAADSKAGAREHTLPTGNLHVVFRLSDQPLRLFADDDDPTGFTAGHALIGGARSRYCVRDVSGPSVAVGAQLRPGAALALFGSPADEFTDRHTPLGDVWGRSAASTREALLEAVDARSQLSVLEAALLARLSRLGTPQALHPAVAQALASLGAAHDVRSAVHDSGYSHRQFIAHFRSAVGLPPKLHCRIRRFQRVLRHLEARPATAWADVAADAGYSDQPHLAREFREFAGVTPQTYRRASPAFAHHVPLRISTPGPANRALASSSPTPPRERAACRHTSIPFKTRAGTAA